jgi:hypothetical protein
LLTLRLANFTDGNECQHRKDGVSPIIIALVLYSLT